MERARHAAADRASAIELARTANDHSRLPHRKLPSALSPRHRLRQPPRPCRRRLAICPAGGRRSLEGGDLRRELRPTTPTPSPAWQAHVCGAFAPNEKSVMDALKACRRRSSSANALWRQGWSRSPGKRPATRSRTGSRWPADRTRKTNRGNHARAEANAPLASAGAATTAPSPRPSGLRWRRPSPSSGGTKALRQRSRRRSPSISSSRSTPRSPTTSSVSRMTRQRSARPAPGRAGRRPGPRHRADQRTVVDAALRHRQQALDLNAIAQKFGWKKLAPIVIQLGSYDGKLIALPKTIETQGALL